MSECFGFTVFLSGACSGIKDWFSNKISVLSQEYLHGHSSDIEVQNRRKPCSPKLWCNIQDILFDAIKFKMCQHHNCHYYLNLTK